MKYVVTFCTLLILSACQLDRGAGDLDRSCGDAGGNVRQGYSGPFCAMPTPDAGASCSDSSQCGGLCLNSGGSGQCSAETPMVGCNDIFEGGQAVTLCID